MIGVQLMGGLGNQMFQYAVARAVAERLGCPLIVMSSYMNRSDKLQYAAGAIGLPVRGYNRVCAEIAQAFPAVTQSRAGVALQIAGARVSRRLFPYRFR